MHTKVSTPKQNMRDIGDKERMSGISGLFYNLIVQWRHCELDLVERVVCSRHRSDISKGHTIQQLTLRTTRENNRL
jgi:hypothetical protein